MAVAGRKPEQIANEIRLRLAEIREEALKSSALYLDSAIAEREPVDALAFLAGCEDIAKRIDAAVIAARQSGVSWTVVAEALGDIEPGASRRAKNRFHKRLADRL